MTTICPNIEPDARFSMVQTARLLGISRSTLYRYLDEGLIKFGIRKINSQKYITGKEIIRIWTQQF